MPRTFLVALLALSACATPVPAPENAYQGLSLPQYLAATRDTQAFKVADLYTPPRAVAESATGLAVYGPGYVLLSDGPATLDLAQGATTYQGFENALAVGLADGDIRVYGARSCAGMDQPVQGAPHNLAWGAQSRWLAVLGASPTTAYIYDTDNCHLEEAVELPEPAATLAVSPSGNLLAIAGTTGRIWTGSPTGKKHLLVETGARLLALGFGPDGGLLFTVTPNGEITLLNTRSGEQLERFQATGGPFDSARFQDHYIVLTTPEGRRFAWDLTTRVQVPFSRKLAQFFLDDGVLRYRTWAGVLHLSPYAGEPSIQVEHSPSHALIRILDLDGRTRWYDQRTGRETAATYATDWQAIQTNVKGNFCIDGRCYMLTDRAFQWDHDVLLCRSVPGVGHFLWWIQNEIPEQYSPLPDHLPERKTILADEAVEWAPVAPPKEFP